MSNSILGQLIARVDAQGESPEAIRKAAQAALLALTPQERKTLRAQLGVRATEEKEDPVRALARGLAKKKR